MRMARLSLLAIWLAVIAPRIGAEIPLPWNRNSIQAVRNLANRQGLRAARQESERALEAARAKQDLISQAYAHFCLGDILDRLNEDSASARHIGQALELASRLPDSFLLARIHMSLHLESLDAGNFGQARQYLKLASEHWEAAAEPSEQSHALFRMSQLEPSGERKRAILERAVAAALKSGDSRAIGAASKALGEILRKYGDYAGSARLLEQALPHLRKSRTPVFYAQAMVSLARVYTQHGQLEQSLETYREALRIFERAGHGPGIVGAYQEMGGTHVMLGRHKEGIPYFERALEVARKEGVEEVLNKRLCMIALGLSEAGEHARAAALIEETMRNPAAPHPSAHWVLSLVYYNMGRYEDALRLATRSVVRTRSLRSVDQRIYAHWWRARALDKLGRRDEAAADLMEAFRLIEKQRGTLIPDDTLKRGFAEKNLPLANDAVAILWGANKRKEALEVAERARARAFLDLLASRDSGAYTAPSALMLHVEEDEPSLPSAASSAPASFEQLGAIAARLGTTLLAYWVHPEAVYAWVITPGGGFDAVRVAIPEARLNTLVERARRTSHKPDHEAWRELHRILVEPLKKSLPAQGATLTILPHRGLFDLPFAALRELSGRYLIETYGLRTAPAAAILERPRPAAGESKSQFLLVGDPTGVAPDDRGKALPPLPGARSEVARIAQQIPGLKILLTGPEAEESRVLSSAPGSAVLHFATHAVLHPSRPFDSYLALSAGSRLTAGEIYNLRLNADLVLLSACRGGSGKVSSDGLLGLTRAFFYAGTSSVIAPVWDIADAPTVELMAEFYRRYRQSGNKSTALRHAQLRLLSMLRAGKLTLDTPAGPVAAPEHPWLWAGFVLQGED